MCRQNSSTGSSMWARATLWAGHQAAGNSYWKCGQGELTPGLSGGLDSVSIIILRSIILFFQLLLNKIPLYANAAIFYEGIIDIYIVLVVGVRTT